MIFFRRSSSLESTSRSHTWPTQATKDAAKNFIKLSSQKDQADTKFSKLNRVMPFFQSNGIKINLLIKKIAWDRSGGISTHGLLRKGVAVRRLYYQGIKVIRDTAQSPHPALNSESNALIIYMIIAPHICSITKWENNSPARLKSEERWWRLRCLM